MIGRKKDYVENVSDKPYSAEKSLLLNLMKQDEHLAVVAVLDSGLLPEPQLRQWLNNLAERAIRRVLGGSGCSEWEVWASRWLSGEDRSKEAALAAAEAAEAEATRASEAVWELWYANQLSSEDRSAEAAEKEAAEAAEAARAATRAATRAAEATWKTARAAGAAGAAAVQAAVWSEERKAQYDDLLNLINGL